MTNSTQDTVARVVEAIGKCMVGSSLEEQAIAALEASHHAELVEALRWAVGRLKAVGHGWTAAEMGPVDALLAKIEGLQQ